MTSGFLSVSVASVASDGTRGVAPLEDGRCGRSGGLVAGSVVSGGLVVLSSLAPAGDRRDRSDVAAQWSVVSGGSAVWRPNWDSRVFGGLFGLVGWSAVPGPSAFCRWVSSNRTGVGGLGGTCRSD